MLILNDRRVRGLSLLGPDPDFLWGLGVDGHPLRCGYDGRDVCHHLPDSDLLTTDFDTDAHAVAYDVYGPDGDLVEVAPRLRKESLAPLVAVGYQVRCLSVMVDVDLQDMGCPKGTSWNDLDAAQTADLRARLQGARPDVGAPTAAWASLRGAKYLHRLSQPVPVGGNYEDLLRAVHDSYHRAGVPADRKCCDWTRLYRCPRVNRGAGVAK